MSAVQYAAFIAVALFLRSSFVAANFTFPSFGGEACKTNVCGKGSCVASNGNPFGFECQCEKGWKQARSENDQFFKFMPCVIPNCTLNFNCVEAPSPAPNPKRNNTSVFDPCYWTDCGGGFCNKTSLFTHSCLCEEGYYNLFNSTAFPCYKECVIGGDCTDLGIGVMNSSNPSPQQSGSAGVAVDSTSHSSILINRVEVSLLIALVATLAPFAWKYDKN